MSSFYDQDNPHGYRNEEHNDTRKNNTPIVNGNIQRRQNSASEEIFDMRQYNQQAKNIAKKSTMTPTQKARARVIKQQQRRQERERRIAALGLTCLILGGVAATNITNLVGRINDEATINSAVLDFRIDVITPNTHRTDNNLYYFYDYDDIAAHINDEEKDFSTELYKAYSSLGEYQTNRVMKYTPYDDVESYVMSQGYDSIRDWEKTERGKILIQSQIDEKQAELSAMQSEYTSQVNSADALNSQNTGGSK